MEYIFTSTTFTGFMRFAYDNNGMIKMFENNARISPVQRDFLCRNFPFIEANLKNIKGTHGVIEQHIDLSFDTFWKKYGHKKGKIKAAEQWNKLSDEARFQAIVYIPKYTYSCKLEGIAMLYPERYIKYRRWEDND